MTPSGPVPNRLPYGFWEKSSWEQRGRSKFRIKIIILDMKIVKQRLARGSTKAYSNFSKQTPYSPRIEAFPHLKY
jgi:hypothetical protein